MTQKGVGRAGRTVGPAPTTEEHESRQALWRYLLIAAALFLVGETVLSNRLPSLRLGAGARGGRP